MEASVYKIEAARTESLISDFTLDGTKVTRNSRLTHAIFGLVTESAELIDALKKSIFYGKPLDVVNLREECGDLLWYLVQLCNACELNFEEFIAKASMMKHPHQDWVWKYADGKEGRVNNIFTSRVIFLIEGSKELLDTLDWETIMPKDHVNQTREKLVGEFIDNVSELLLALDTTFADVMERNIAKLKARYPGKFTTENAVNRDLVKERAILEGKA